MQEIKASNEAIYIKITCGSDFCEKLRDQGDLFMTIAERLELDRDLHIEEFVPEDFGLKTDSKGNIIK